MAFVLGVFASGAVDIGINSLQNNLTNANSSQLGFLSNEGFINGLYYDLNLTDPKNVFRFVFSNLKDHVVVYPTENYYYFTLPAHGKTIFGNIALSAYQRDQGVLSFAYFEKGDNFAGPESPSTGHSVYYTGEDGVFVKKIDDFHYSVSFEGKTVIFELNDVGVNPPTKAILLNDEIFVGPSFDESGLKFFLIFNNTTKHLYWILNEENFVPESFSKYNGSILFGNRTEYAFYEDERNNRKILVGAKDLNVLQNNWYDGPADQMPENYVYSGKVEIKKYLEFTSPHLNIDKYGRNIDLKGNKVTSMSYFFYPSKEALVSIIDSCLGQFHGSEFYTCITKPM